MNENKKELEEMKKRLGILKEDSWEMDLIAGELMEERAKIQEDIAPKLAALENIDYKLKAICARKGQNLVSYRLGLNIVNGLKGAEDPAEAMEVC